MRYTTIEIIGFFFIFFFFFFSSSVLLQTIVNFQLIHSRVSISNGTMRDQVYFVVTEYRTPLNTI